MNNSSLVKLKLTYTNNTSGKVLQHMILKINSSFLQSKLQSRHVHSIYGPASGFRLSGEIL